MVAKRRKSSQKFDSLAVVTNSGSKNPSPMNSVNDATPNGSTSKSSSKKTTVQTGLKAFFSATPANGKKKKTKGTGSKRKESPSNDDLTGSSSSGSDSAASTPAGKKLKKTATTETEPEDMEVEQSNGVNVVVID